MAGLLTTIYAGSGQNCGYSQILARFNARLTFARFALFATLTFKVLFTWGFAETANL